MGRLMMEIKPVFYPPPQVVSDQIFVLHTPLCGLCMDAGPYHPWPRGVGDWFQASPIWLMKVLCVFGFACALCNVCGMSENQPQGDTAGEYVHLACAGSPPPMSQRSKYTPMPSF